MEIPIHVQEDAPRARQVLRDDRVEQAGGDAALDDDPPKARCRCPLLVIVKRVAVARELGEELDVTLADCPSSGGFLAHPPRRHPCSVEPPRRPTIRVTPDLVMVAALARDRRSDTPRVGWYEPLEWVLVRSPLLPVERYAELWSGTDSEAGLPQAVRDPVVRRAIAVASPSLFERLGRPPSSPSALRRWRLAVLRYLIRMSTRPTPYGLNAAVSLAGWGAKTDLELGSGEVVRARLDMGLLDAVIGELESRPEVVRQLRLETHPTVTVRAGRAFLPERLAGGSGAFEVSVRATRPVLRALDFCRAAPVPFAEIAGALGEEFPDAGPRIGELIHTLVREGLLVTELRPPLTRGDPAGYLLSRLDRI